MSQENRPLRESIWTVAGEWTKVYFAVFTPLNIMNIARVIWFQTTQAQHADWSPMASAILEDVGRGALGIASVSIGITDIWRLTKMLAIVVEMWLTRRRERKAEVVAQNEARLRAEGEAKGRVEGVTETDALWRAWNGRRLDALANGEPFDEPPPDIAEPSANGR